MCAICLHFVLSTTLFSDIVQQGNVAEALRLTEEYLTFGNGIIACA